MTWISRASGGRHSRLSREERLDFEKLWSEHSGGSAGQSRTPLAAPQLAFRIDRESPPEEFFFFSLVLGRATEERPRRWMLLSCAAHASWRGGLPWPRRVSRRLSPPSRKGRGSAPARARPRAARPQLGPCLPVLPPRLMRRGARSRPHRDPGRVALLGRPPRFGLGEFQGGRPRAAGAGCTGGAGRAAGAGPWGAAWGPGPREGKEVGPPPIAARTARGALKAG